MTSIEPQDEAWWRFFYVQDVRYGAVPWMNWSVDIQSGLLLQASCKRTYPVNRSRQSNILGKSLANLNNAAPCHPWHRAIPYILYIKKQSPLRLCFIVTAIRQAYLSSLGFTYKTRLCSTSSYPNSSAILCCSFSISSFMNSMTLPVFTQTM